jgi:plastocyanin
MLRLAARARTFGVATAVAIGSIGVLAPLPASAAWAQTTWNITVGGGDFASAASLDRFYVSNITVHPSDVVNFNWQGFHTVTFNPLAGKSVLDYVFPPGLTGSTTLDTPATFVNGLPGGGGGPGSPPPPPFTLTIGAELPNGTYHYQCMLHQFMHGSIRVTRGDLPSTDAENQTRAQAQMAVDIARAASLNAAFTRRGSENEGEALVGAGDHTVDLINYYPTEVRVQAGQQVTFKLADFGDPHSVTFGYANANPPLAPPGEIFASAPSPATYGGGDLNSGYLMSRSMFKYWNLAGKLPGFTRRSEYTITFTTPGTYGFYCTIHGGILPDGTVVGMSGHVTVVAPEDDHAGDRAAS